jgi:type IV secretory pathway VirB10-like protein
MATAEGRVCTVCKAFKLAAEFGFKKYVRKDGVERVYLKSQCKKCRYKADISTEEQRRAYNKKAAENRLKRLAAMTEAELEAYKAKHRQMQQAWANKDREKYLAWKKEWSLKRRDKEIAYKRQRYAEKKDELRAKCHEYYLQNKEAILERNKRYNALPETKERRKLYQKQRRAEDRVTIRQKIAELNSNYVKLVIRRGTNLKHRHIPESLVEAKRAQLMILRSLRNEKR